MTPEDLPQQGGRFHYTQHETYPKTLPVTVVRVRPPQGREWTYHVLFKYDARDDPHEEIHDVSLGTFWSAVREEAVV